MVEVPQKALYTKAAKANARGNAQANIMIIPNCKASSKQSASDFNQLKRWKYSENFMVALKIASERIQFQFSFYRRHTFFS
jgi:hypothetical protein